jgi:hypothetical protein
MRFFERPGGFVEMIIPQIVQKENSVLHRQKLKDNESTTKDKKEKRPHSKRAAWAQKMRSMGIIFLKKS